MFRPMRRCRQQLSDEQAIEILKAGKTGVLGLLGDEGYPYTVPLNYVYAEGRLYFHCAKTGHKQDAIARCDKASFCVIDGDEIVPEKLTTRFRSVVLFGRIRRLETEEEIVRAARLLGCKFSGDKDAVDREIAGSLDRLSCLEMTIEHLSGKEAIELTREREG